MSCLLDKIDKIWGSGDLPRLSMVVWLSTGILRGTLLTVGEPVHPQDSLIGT